MHMCSQRYILKSSQQHCLYLAKIRNISCSSIAEWIVNMCYKCGIVYSNKELTTATCNNNMNVTNIMLSKKSHTKNNTYCRHLYSF